MAVGANPHANQTSVRLKESVTAVWGIVTPKGLSCFWGTLWSFGGIKTCKLGCIPGGKQGLDRKGQVVDIVAVWAARNMGQDGICRGVHLKLCGSLTVRFQVGELKT